MSSRIRSRLAAFVVAGALAGSVVVATSAPASAATVNCSISATRTVRYNDTGTCVKLVQQRLGGLSLDSHFGSLTDAAVRQFQRANGLSADGVVGPATWTKIKQGLPRQGTVIYAGTSSHAGVTAYACRNSASTGVRYAVRNKTSSTFNQVTLWRSGSSSGTYVTYIAPGRTVSQSAYQATGSTGSFRRVEVKLSNGTTRSVNRTFSFTRNRLPICR